MDDLPIATHTTPSHTNIMLSESSSGGDNSSFDEPELVEISPPPNWKSRANKQKSIVDDGVIAVDDEDSDDIMIIDEKPASNSKGKKPMFDYIDVDDVSLPNGQGCPFLQGDWSYHVSLSGDDFAGIDDDLPEIDCLDPVSEDECTILEDCFDKLDIPPGVEATIPWWPASAGDKTHAVSAIASNSYSAGAQSDLSTAGAQSDLNTAGTQSDVNMGIPMVDQFQSWTSVEPLQSTKPVSETSVSASSSYLPGAESYLIMGAPMGYQYQSWNSAGPFDATNSVRAAKLPSSVCRAKSNINKQKFGMIPSMFHSQAGSMWASNTPSMAQMHAYPVNEVEFSPHTLYVNPSLRLDDNITAGISPPSSNGVGDKSDLYKRENFQRFDCVEDHSDHYYSKVKESFTQSKSWKKKIITEWERLKDALPETIFVRVYETRMDLLRAVILGADNTPYHDGLFVFDVYFGHLYPDVPPCVNYHCHGLRINPNLYENGKVCLSLLGTWSGSKDENWLPGKSNMLQVLLSIQALILNTEPYYNEPAFSKLRNDEASKKYSESAFLLSLKTMLYTMRNPPKGFEGLVYGHFYERAHDILTACRAYLNGASVGSFVKGKTKLDKAKTCKITSNVLSEALPNYIKSLVEAFTKIGVKDCEKFLVPVDNTKASQSTPKQKRSWNVFGYPFHN